MLGQPHSFHVRMIRAALGDPELYPELARDPGAIRQSVFVVVLIAVLHGLAASLGTFYSDSARTASSVFISAFAFTAFGWAASALFTYMLVSLFSSFSAAGFQGGSFMRFLHSAGFTASPGILLILTPIDFLANVVVIASIFWIATAMFIAVRESLHTSNTVAASAVFIGHVAGRLFVGLLVAFAASSGI